MRSTHRGRLTAPLLITLGLLSAVSPLATDLYLPALPQIVDDFGSSATLAQLTFTGFMLGMTVGQLLFGPISDRFGRRWPLVLGTIAFVLASAWATFAPSMTDLIVARTVQGISGAAAMVIGRAVVNDLVTGAAAARAFNLLIMITGVAPVAAPVIGGMFASITGWRGLMGIVLALAVPLLVLVLVVVPETYPRAERDAARAMSRPGAGAWRGLVNRTFIGYSLVFGFGFGTMMAYISASPFVFQRMMGLNEFASGALLGAGAIAMVITTGVSARLVGRVAVHRLLGLGVGLMLTGSSGIGVLVWVGAPPLSYLIALFPVVLGSGFLIGNATALAMAAAPPSVAGLASAILGAAQFGTAALVSPWVNIGGERTAVPLAIVMLSCGLIALAGFALGRSGERRAAAPRARLAQPVG